ncbi:ethanolamine ammonia-lyase subunit EutC [Aneurinibacillus tyrosinisolvens]|uniref:ethanolamine ammonia-lyase subunit EutC n=1 Tax=Aneurinibacillus tyrosinisolvens TaxID=1443435 RepID=UPI00063EE86B|nr:ethanolamine ammonia-lyase subunit EutC [Aneurinibacillus tyrosinisolvens]
METQLIETITRIVLEKLKNNQEISQSPTPAKEPEKASRYGAVKVWSYVDSPPEPIREEQAQPPAPQPAKAEPDEKPVQQTGKRAGIKKPFNKEVLDRLVNKTPARIGVGRAGVRPKTDTWLQFRSDHAAAVDAVYGTVEAKLLETLQLFTVKTQVKNKEEYILRPDLGRRLTEASIQTIRERCVMAPKVQIVVSDGLSSQAIEQNLEDVYLSFKQSLNGLGLTDGTPFFVEKGRVAVMDDIGEALQPEVVVLFIGERPGLVSAESLSAYLCYKPRRGTIEADRMVISNIHSGGIPPAEAGAYLGNVVQKILKYEASGVSLVQKET